MTHSPCIEVRATAGHLVAPHCEPHPRCSSGRHLGCPPRLPAPKPGPHDARTRLAAASFERQSSPPLARDDPSDVPLQCVLDPLERRGGYSARSRPEKGGSCSATSST